MKALVLSKSAVLVLALTMLVSIAAYPNATHVQAAQSSTPSASTGTLNASGKLKLTKRANNEIAGELGHAGSLVVFKGHRNAGKQDVAHIEVNGMLIDAMRDSAQGTVQHTGYDRALSLADKQALIALIEELSLIIPSDVRQLPPQEDLLLRIVGRYAEAPVGLPLTSRSVGKGIERSIDPVAQQAEPRVAGIPIVTPDQHGVVAGKCSAAFAAGDATVITAACEVQDEDGTPILTTVGHITLRITTTHAIAMMAPRPSMDFLG